MVGRSFTWLAGTALFTVLGIFAACNEPNDPGGKEDKDGVNNVPPGKSTSSGDGGEGGGLGPVCTENVDCDDENLCTIDECVDFHCTNTEENNPDPCTLSVCDPDTGMITTSFSQVIFSEGFADNLQEWTLEGQWAFAATAPSTGGLDQGNDPANDAANMPGGFAAQTAPGALVNPTGGIAERLRSPAIDLSGLSAADFFTLRFKRWLNSDAPPIMTVKVEVNDGAQEVVVWENVGKIIDAPPHGTGWFEVRLDVSGPFRAALENGASPTVSFTMLKNGSGQSVGGWTIDDLTIERALFPVDDLLCTLDSCVAVDGMAVPVGTPMPAIVDTIDCTTFVCDAGSLDNPTQAENTPDCIIEPPPP
jgi:hypothetical protein